MARKVTGLVHADVGHDGIDAPQINPRSGLHRNQATFGLFDLSGSNSTQYGICFQDNDVVLQKVTVTAVEAVVTGQEAVIQLGILGDADEFGELDFQTDSPVDDGMDASETVDASSFLLENEALLQAGEVLTCSLTGDGDGGGGTVLVHVEYVILDDDATA